MLGHVLPITSILRWGHVLPIIMRWHLDSVSNSNAKVKDGVLHHVVMFAISLYSVSTCKYNIHKYIDVQFA